MDSLFQSKLNTCARIEAFINHPDHHDLLFDIAEFEDEYNIFKSTMDQIQVAFAHQMETSTITGPEADVLKRKMAEKMIKFSKRGLVKARKVQNNELINVFGYAVSEIYKASKLMSIERSNEILHGMKNIVVSALYLPADFTEATNAIDAYNAAKDIPIIDIQKRSATGTKQLHGLFQTAFDAIENMNLLVNSYYDDTKPVLVDGFEASIQVIKPGTRHSGIEGHVYLAGVPVANAIIAIQGTEKTTKTDLLGHYVLVQVNPGLYAIDVTMADGAMHTKNIQIHKGVVEVLNFD
jgi:hypothetical protein